MTTRWPSAALILSATARAIMSLVPPGGSGITSVIGLVGYCWACAGAATPATVIASADSKRPCERDVRIRVTSLWLKADLVHEPRPLRMLLLDQDGVFLRRARHRLGAVGRKTLTHLIRSKRDPQRPVERLDDRRRRACGRDQPVLLRRLVARHTCFRDGGQLRKQVRTLRAGDPQRPHLAPSDISVRLHDRYELHL